MPVECFDVCGTNTLSRIKAYLRAQGYTQGSCRNPGKFTYTPTDGAPGWSDWMYEVQIHPLPGHTVESLLQGFREQDPP